MPGAAPEASAPLTSEGRAEPKSGNPDFHLVLPEVP
jgi:hypothetical protein